MQLSSLNVSKNEQGKTWGQHHANYEEHVTEPFVQFLCSAFHKSVAMS